MATRTYSCVLLQVKSTQYLVNWKLANLAILWRAGSSTLTCSTANYIGWIFSLRLNPNWLIKCCNRVLSAACITRIEWFSTCKLSWVFDSSVIIGITIITEEFFIGLIDVVMSTGSLFCVLGLYQCLLFIKLTKCGFCLDYAAHMSFLSLLLFPLFHF